MLIKSTHIKLGSEPLFLCPPGVIGSFFYTHTNSYRRQAPAVLSLFRVRSSFNSMQNMLTIISNALCRITGRNVVSVWGVNIELEAADAIMLTD